MTRTLMLATAIVTVLSPAARALGMFPPGSSWPTAPKPQTNISKSISSPHITPGASANLPAVQKTLRPQALTGGMPGPNPCRQCSPLATNPMPHIPGPQQGGSAVSNINR